MTWSAFTSRCPTWLILPFSIRTSPGEITGPETGCTVAFLSRSVCACVNAAARQHAPSAIERAKSFTKSGCKFRFIAFVVVEVILMFQGRFKKLSLGSRASFVVRTGGIENFPGLGQEGFPLRF